MAIFIKMLYLLFLLFLNELKYFKILSYNFWLSKYW